MRFLIAGAFALGVFLSLAVGSWVGFTMAAVLYLAMVATLAGVTPSLALFRWPSPQSLLPHIVALASGIAGALAVFWGAFQSVAVRVIATGRTLPQRVVVVVRSRGPGTMDAMRGAVLSFPARAKATVWSLTPRTLLMLVVALLLLPLLLADLALTYARAHPQQLTIWRRLPPLWQRHSTPSEDVDEPPVPDESSPEEAVALEQAA